MNRNILRVMQGYPLEVKIEKSKQRIREFYDHCDGEIYVSFSGGKDSTVLLHLVRSVFPNVVGVYCDTGLEYPEVKQFVNTVDNITTIRPKESFKEVIQKYGYPVISKEQSQFLHQLRVAKSEKTINTRLNGNKWGRGKISEKWKFLINAPFKVSDQCCNVMKKRPFAKYEKLTGKKPLIGTLANESALRETHYLKNGCNHFNLKRVKSTPLGFWTEKDILDYIVKFNLEIPSVYGEIKNGELTGLNRTGCVYCLYGIHQDKGKNRIEKLKETHPLLYNYCLNNLGLKEVLDFIKIKY